MAAGKTFKRLKKDIAYILIRLIIGFFRMLPRRAALNIGSVIGRIASYCAKKEFNLAIKHLTIAFGNEIDKNEICRLAHESFRYMAMNFIDTVRLRVMRPDEIKEICVPHNIDRLWKALNKGHGVIGLTSHTGCWELLGIYLAIIGVPVYAIARRLYDPRLEKMLFDTRTDGGIHTISRGHNTKDIIRVLKDGHLLGVLVDQDTKVKGVFVDFFGKPAHTATAPALLSLKYKSSIVPIFTYRDNHHRHHVCIGEEVEVEPGAGIENNVMEITYQCSKVTENFIRDHPEQWVWFHKRWKKQPERDSGFNR